MLPRRAGYFIADILHLLAIGIDAERLCDVHGHMPGLMPPRLGELHGRRYGGNDHHRLPCCEIGVGHPGVLLAARDVPIGRAQHLAVASDGVHGLQYLADIPGSHGIVYRTLPTVAVERKALPYHVL